MPKPVAEVGEGNGDASGNGVYCFIRDLIVEGRDARFVDKNGRYVINWSRALKSYHDYKSKRNPQYKSKNISRRKASNGLRAALLNFYKKEGAKEYKDCKKVNEKDEVVERQFQMPPRVFESLFGSDAQLPDDSSEHETSSIGSEADEKPLATPNSSDTGFDEAMDISDDLFNANEDLSSHSALGGLSAGDPQCSNVKTEEEQVDPSDITTPCQMFDISEEELDLVLGEICSNSDTNDIDLLGVVRDICPSSGSVKGGMQFYISLTEELSEDDKSGIAHFDGIGDVYLERLNCYTLAGTIPASQQPGPVPVTVNTQDGRLLGMTYFMYVDEIQEVLKQVVKDQALQSLFFTMWSQEHGFFGSDGNLDPFTLQGQGSSVQGTHAQALKGLQLLVYTAAQTNAQQFIQMIFSTSAGRLVFNAYKDRPQLPEDVARANGHDDLAQYLHNVNARLSKENSNDAQPSSIDWFELIEAVNKIQKQSSVVEDETDLEIGQSKDDDNESDYFADAETSSCGSFELDIGWSDSEDWEGPCSKGGGSDKEPDVKSASSMNVMPCKAYMCAEVETQSDNDLDLEDDKNSEEGEVKEVCDTGCFGQQIGVATQKRENTSEREQDPRACLDQETCMQLKHEQPKKEPGEMLTQFMEGTSSEAPSVFGTNLDNEVDQKADGKNDRKLSTTEVGKSSLVSQLSKKVTASGKEEEEASTFPSQEKTTKLKSIMKWLKGDAVTTSSQRGACVNETQEVPSFGERNYQGLTGGGVQNRENINDRKEDSTTGPSHAKRHKQQAQWRPFRRTLLKSFLLLTIAVITVLCLAAGIKLREGQLLHWAVRNGHIRISQALLKFVSDVDAPNFRGETPLHVAAKNGYKDLAELLMKLGSNVNFKDYQQQTPLHLAARSGCHGIANALIRHRSDVNAQDDSQQTPLHLAARSGCQGIANALIRPGSDVNARDDFQQTPLHLAAWSGCQGIANGLIRHGSDVKDREDSLRTALHLAALNEHRDSQQSLLHLAAQNGHENIVEFFLQLGSVIYAIDTFRQTPLHFTAWSGDKEIREFLMQHGSEPKTQDDFQQISLHLAAGNGHGSESKARDDLKPNADVNVTNNHNQLPPRLAAENGHKHLHKVSLQRYQCVNARDNFGKRSLQLSTINRNEGLADDFFMHNRSVDSHGQSFILQSLSGEKFLFQESTKSRYRRVNQSIEKYVTKGIGCKNGTTCKNGTNKVLIYLQILHKQISYEEYHFVKAMEVVFLITLAALYICINLIWEPSLNFVYYLTSVVAECCQPPANPSSASDQPGAVPVTVKTQDGPLLEMADVLFVGEMQDVMKQLVNISQNLGPFTLQDQGSSIQGTHAQVLEVLQLLVYTAAQRNDQQVIQMIFRTSAGRLVFNTYKDRPQLPEDVARANGHDDLTQYLQDVNARLSKESSNDAQPNVIDCLELTEAVSDILKQFYAKSLPQIARRKGCKDDSFKDSHKSWQNKRFEGIHLQHQDSDATASVTEGSLIEYDSLLSGVFRKRAYCGDWLRTLPIHDPNSDATVSEAEGSQIAGSSLYPGFVCCEDGNFSKEKDEVWQMKSNIFATEEHIQPQDSDASETEGFQIVGSSSSPVREGCEDDNFKVKTGLIKREHLLRQVSVPTASKSKLLLIVRERVFSLPFGAYLKEVYCRDWPETLLIEHCPLNIYNPNSDATASEAEGSQIAGFSLCTVQEGNFNILHTQDSVATASVGKSWSQIWVCCADGYRKDWDQTWHIKRFKGKQSQPQDSDATASETKVSQITGSSFCPVFVCCEDGDFSKEKDEVWQMIRNIFTTEEHIQPQDSDASEREGLQIVGSSSSPVREGCEDDSKDPCRKLDDKFLFSSTHE